MKTIQLICIGCMLVISVAAAAQKTISEGTIIYDIQISPKAAGTKVNSGLNGAQTTVFLKGGLSRTDMTSPLGTETIIYNGKLGNAAILKEYSGQKLMITLTRENWESLNRKYDGTTFQDIAGTKIIEGYNCKHATTRLGDGSSISVYYSPDLIAINKDYNQAFKNLKGFPMEYELETPKRILKYSVAKIDFSPLPSSKFDFPKFGYRIMSYEENKNREE